MFEIFQDEADEWRFRLRAGNHETIITSESYTRKADAVRAVDTAIETVRDAGLSIKILDKPVDVEPADEEG